MRSSGLLREVSLHLLIHLLMVDSHLLSCKVAHFVQLFRDFSRVHDYVVIRLSSTRLTLSHLLSIWLRLTILPLLSLSHRLLLLLLHHELMILGRINLTGPIPWMHSLSGAARTSGLVKQDGWMCNLSFATSSALGVGPKARLMMWLHFIILWFLLMGELT